MKKAQEGMNVVMVGSAYESVFEGARTPLFDLTNMERVTIQSDPQLGGIILLGTSFGVEVPIAQAGTKKIVMPSMTPKCILFLADGSDDDLAKFKALASLDQYILLIVKTSDPAKISTWCQAAEGKKKVLMSLNPRSSDEAQQFIGKCIQSVLVLQNMDANGW
jgi:hypothetical protein